MNTLQDEKIIYKDASDIAYKKAAKVFTVIGNIMLIVFLIGTMSGIGILYMQENLSLEAVFNQFWNVRTAVTLINYVIYIAVASGLAEKKRWAVIVGKIISLIVLAKAISILYLSVSAPQVNFSPIVLALLIMPLGIWPLIRLHDKNI